VHTSLDKLFTDFLIHSSTIPKLLVAIQQLSLKAKKKCDIKVFICFECLHDSINMQVGPLKPNKPFSN